ncbi:hypothetical protein HED96_004982 [Salmonella enterica]|nr:hypothetical protein [Salmonella enterica]
MPATSFDNQTGAAPETSSGPSPVLRFPQLFERFRIAKDLLIFNRLIFNDLIFITLIYPQPCR